LRKKLYQLQKINNLSIDEELKAQANGFRMIAGIDEAGRGPLAGPVVACSVILKNFDFSARIDDSKKLRPVERERAYQEISSKAIIGIGIVAEDIIDKINIFKATMLAMEQSILGLASLPDFLLVDGNMRLRPRISQLTLIRGDQKSLSIACASIIAKVTRDRLLRFYDNIFPGYGFSRHKGYGTRQHIAAIIKKGFSPIHRRSFKVK
jgi:ribonuclease HII